MTDKEIARQLSNARWWARRCAAYSGQIPSVIYLRAMISVQIIHHIINSINWED